MLSPLLFDCMCGGGICCFRTVLMPFLIKFVFAFSSGYLVRLLGLALAIAFLLALSFVLPGSYCDDDDSKDAGTDNDDDDGGDGG